MLIRHHGFTDYNAQTLVVSNSCLFFKGTNLDFLNYSLYDGPDCTLLICCIGVEVFLGSTDYPPLQNFVCVEFSFLDSLDKAKMPDLD